MRLIRLTTLLLCFLCSVNAVASIDTAAINQTVSRAKGYRTSMPDSSISISLKTLKQSREAGHMKGVLCSYNNIGMSYWVKGDFNNGLIYMHKMIKGAIACADSDQIASAYGNTAILYIDMGDRQTGLDYSRKAIDIYTALGDSVNCVHNINNIGWIYYAMKEYDSAVVYYNRAIYGYEQYFSDKSWLGQAYANLSRIYVETDRAGMALNYAQKALYICRQYDHNKKAIGHAYLGMANALLLSKQYAASTLYADSALKIAETSNIHTLTAEAYWVKYMASEQTGDYKEAIAFLALNTKWRDSLLNEETNATLTNIKTQLTAEKKDKEIAQKEKQLAESKAARQQNFFLLILAVIIAIFAIVIAYQVHKRQQLRINAKSKQLEVEQKEKELAEANLKNHELKNEELSKELLSFTLTTTQKNQLLQDISDELGNIKTEDAGQVRKVKHIINSALSSEEEWQEFKVRFEQVYVSFFDKVKSDHPQLSANDLRLCAFIKLNLNSKQIASLLNIAPSSVDISKYRLKKKLGLEKEDNIADFIEKY